jgi:hypothetical protein
MVSYLPEVHLYLKELSLLLYEKGYFVFYENAEEYVIKLVTHIESNISTLPKKVAPDRFNRFGKNMHYITYRPNRHTTWYIFFQSKNDNYVVRYITNNHVSAQHIRGLR